MLQCLLCSDPLGRIDLQHALEKVHHFRISFYVFRAIQVEAAQSVFAEDFIVSFSLEDAFAEVENVEY